MVAIQGCGVAVTITLGDAVVTIEEQRLLDVELRRIGKNLRFKNLPPEVLLDAAFFPFLIFRTYCQYPTIFAPGCFVFE